MKAKPVAKTLLWDILFDLAGCFAFAASVQCFCAPNNIAPGGVSGVAILLHFLLDLPISAVSFVLNVPLMLLAWLLLGKGFTLRTVKSVAILTAMLEACTLLPVYSGNLILASLYGGVLGGAGLALVFLRGSTTGGTDIASRLIQLKFPYVSVGKLMLCVDGAVLLASAIVYRNIESALYGLIVIFTLGRVVDSVLFGMDRGKVMMIVSDFHSEIAGRIHRNLERGCTVLEGQGAYTSQNRPVLLCAVRKQQFIPLKKIVYAVDPAAFVLVLDATEIIGEGFKEEPQSR